MASVASFNWKLDSLTFIVIFVKNRAIERFVETLVVSLGEEEHRFCRTFWGFLKALNSLTKKQIAQHKVLSSFDTIFRIIYLSIWIFAQTRQQHSVRIRHVRN